MRSGAEGACHQGERLLGRIEHLIRGGGGLPVSLGVNLVADVGNGGKGVFGGAGEGGFVAIGGGGEVGKDGGGVVNEEGGGGAGGCVGFGGGVVGGVGGDDFDLVMAIGEGAGVPVIGLVFEVFGEGGPRLGGGSLQTRGDLGGVPSRGGRRGCRCWGRWQPRR